MYVFIYLQVALIIKGGGRSANRTGRPNTTGGPQIIIKRAGSLGIWNWRTQNENKKGRAARYMDGLFTKLPMICSLEICVVDTHCNGLSLAKEKICDY